MADEQKADSRPYGRGEEGFSAEEIDEAGRRIDEWARQKQAERRRAEAEAATANRREVAPHDDTEEGRAV